MASTSAAIEGDLRRLFDVGAVAGLTDKELLERFLRRDSGSSAAFEAILTRHGPAVWSACHRHGPAAWSEDVFQATFLILIRRAEVLRINGSLAPWLLEVTRRTALKAGAAERRRRVREGRVALPQSAGIAPNLPDDIAPQVRAEVLRLPAKYRQPVHLCYFEGRTHDEAAIALDWPVGTVRGRLARAREMLRAPALFAAGSHRRDGLQRWAWASPAAKSLHPSARRRWPPQRPRHLRPRVSSCWRTR